MSNYGNRPPDYYSIYKLPQTELIKLVQLDEYENVIYIVTSDKYAENYFLYEVKNKKAKKTKTQSSPIFQKIEKYMEDWRSKCKTIEESE